MLIKLEPYTEIVMLIKELCFPETVMLTKV